MKLKYRYTAEADIPAEHKALFIKKGEAWVLDAEGAEDGERFGEFRDNNKAFLAALGAKTPKEALEKLNALKDVDPAKYAELTTKAATEEQERLKKEKGIEAAYQEQIRLLNERNAKALTDSQTRYGQLQSTLEQELITNKVAAAALKKGVLPTAIHDATALARGCFKMKDGAVVAEQDGSPVIGSDGKSITFEEWFDKRAEDRPHWFGKNSGGGAGGGNAGASNGYNPYAPTKESPQGNLYKQGLLEKQNPQQAAALRAAAGK